MVYLDGDMQVFDNIDHLFELPDKYFYAVADCICDTYGEPCPEVLPWPKELGPRPSIYFNAGMFVFQPNLSIYVRLLNTLKVTPPTQFAEQVLQYNLTQKKNTIRKLCGWLSELLFCRVSSIPHPSFTD